MNKPLIMQNFIRICSRLLLMLISASAHSFANENSLPEAIKPPAGHHQVLLAHALGEQIYQCTLSAGIYAWQFLKPAAKLYDQQKQLIGEHTTGPSWLDKHGGLVQGKAIAQTDALKAGAIPWLLIKVVNHQGRTPLSQAEYINRINTDGGLKPGSACDGNHLGQTKGVAYSADYVFYQPD